MRIVEFRKGVPVVPSARKSWFDEEKVILRSLLRTQVIDEGIKS